MGAGSPSAFDRAEGRRPLVLLLLTTTTYRTADFLAAVRALDLDVVVGSNSVQALADRAPGRTECLALDRPEQAIETVRDLHAGRPLAAIVGVDEETTLLAAWLAAAIGLPHNPVESLRAAGNKEVLRRVLGAAGIPGPAFSVHDLEEAALDVAGAVGYPCVLKPLVLSASRGVIRADDEGSFVEAWARVRSILVGPDLPQREPEALRRILVESYVPGSEVAVEGLVEEGRLRVLAVFDKPDLLEGPFFEETIYLTPSRQEQPVLAAIEEMTARGVAALDLATGPVHAELRLPPEGPPILIELAARTIGGLCSRMVRFGTGLSLESLVLGQAVGRTLASLEPIGSPAGVLMLPVPRAGRLVAVRGIEAASSVPGVEEVTITVNPGQEVVPLPEGARYPGFVFARGPTTEAVESALRSAGQAIELVLE